MQRLFSIVFSLSLSAACSTLQAQMPLKLADAQGREATLEVLGICKQGLIYRNARQKVSTLQWQQLDVDYLEKNYPQLHEVYLRMQHEDYSGAERVAIENVLSARAETEQKPAAQVDAKLQPLQDCRAALLAKLQECDGKLAKSYRSLLQPETYASATYKQRCHVNAELLALVKACEECGEALKLVDDSPQKAAFAGMLAKALGALQQINAAPAIPKKEWIRALEPLAQNLGL